MHDYLTWHNNRRQSVGFYRESITLYKYLQKVYNGSAGIIDNLYGTPTSHYSETSNLSILLVKGYDALQVL
jgi:hypothetical protein